MPALFLEPDPPFKLQAQTSPSFPAVEVEQILQEIWCKPSVSWGLGRLAAVRWALRTGMIGRVVAWPGVGTIRHVR